MRRRQHRLVRLDHILMPKSKLCLNQKLPLDILQQHLGQRTTQKLDRHLYTVCHTARRENQKRGTDGSACDIVARCFFHHHNITESHQRTCSFVRLSKNAHVSPVPPLPTVITESRNEHVSRPSSPSPPRFSSERGTQTTIATRRHHHRAHHHQPRTQVFHLRVMFSDPKLRTMLRTILRSITLMLSSGCRRLQI